MRKYSVELADTNTDATTIAGLNQPATPLHRIHLYEISISSRATPAEQSCGYRLGRSTAIGTSTAVTPQRLDLADSAASAVAGQAHTVEPTYTANATMWFRNVHQKATHVWVARPGMEIVIPVNTSPTIDGLGMLCVVPTTAFVATVTFSFFE